ncbi:hypothetical protein H0H87_002214, partial [Tephrocybe sp. NHM501043]
SPYDVRRQETTPSECDFADLLASLSYIACLVTFAAWETNFVFIAIGFVINKMFFNSLLATLNTREELSQKFYNNSQGTWFLNNNMDIDGSPHAMSKHDPIEVINIRRDGDREI